MAVILCPKCGKENPDSLSVCQYCQTSLSSATSMKIGDKPTKKNTGELEPVLPDWLREMRQQARDSAEKDAAEAASMPKIQKEEPPDLLAGLASQSSKADEDELPGWLTGLTSKKEEKPASSVSPAQPASDFFAQFDKPASAPKSEPEPRQSPSLLNKAAEQPPNQPEQDDLSNWFAKASEEPSEPFSLDSDATSPDLEWGFKDDSASSSPQQPTASQEEDLSWLRNLEAESKKTGELSQPKQEDHWSSVLGSSNQDDLSWLDSLGGQPASEQPGQEPSNAEEDLGWLNAFAGTPQTPQSAVTPPASQPASQDDLSWLDSLDALPQSGQPAPDASRQDDVSWLNAFAGTAAAAQNKDIPPAAKEDQSASEDDLSWLRDLQGPPGTFSASLSDSAIEQSKAAGTGEMDSMPHVPPFSPRQTAPLSDVTGPELPDWLKSATAEPSMPMSPQALDRMREEQKLPDESEANISRALFGAVMLSRDEQPASPTPEPASVEPASHPDEAAPLYNEVSSLFSDELPDWLSSSQPVDSQPAEEIGIHAEGGEALSPADLPSWVKDLRPVEAMIATSAPGVNDMPAEREGPLAGLKGVIPAAAFLSLRRPRPIPLTLQTTEDQQASAAILEQILVGETTPRPLASAPAMASQQRLRWVLASLLLLVLGAVLFAGTQAMPVSPALPPEATNVTNVVLNIADNAPVLVIMDYQPALAGEMEAVSGPLLDQLVRLHNPYLSFIATSPNGNALVERLLAKTNISQPGGAGYVFGQNYTNLGYLPGGEAGVLAFLQSPQTAVPSSPVLDFSEYAAILLLTDHAESARTWVEQLSIMKQADPTLASQPLLAVASAQTGPMLQPYFSSGQITGMISGLPIAARYESLNDNRPGMARTYWDAFGIGMMMAVLLIVLGSLWSAYTGIRDSRMKAAEE